MNNRVNEHEKHADRLEQKMNVSGKERDEFDQKHDELLDHLGTQLAYHGTDSQNRYTERGKEIDNLRERVNSAGGRVARGTVVHY